MSPLKMVLVFAPWLAFLVIAQGSLFRLKLGLVIAAVLCIVLGLLRIHRGIILWAGLLFFVIATVCVVGFENAFIIRYMGVLTSGFLGAAAWIGIALGKPFTLDYAREAVDKALWTDKGFIRSNVLISSSWAAVFCANAVLALGKAHHFLLADPVYEITSNALLVGAVVFTSWYTKRVRARRARG